MAQAASDAKHADSHLWKASEFEHHINTERRCRDRAKGRDAGDLRCTVNNHTSASAAPAMLSASDALACDDHQFGGTQSVS